MANNGRQPQPYPRIIERSPTQTNLARLDTHNLRQSARHLSPSSGSNRTRDASASSRSSNTSNTSFSFEKGDHNKSRRLRVVWMNNRVEDHKFETIEKKLAWIEKHRDQIKTVDDKKLKPKLPKPTVDSTNGALVGAGAGAASPYQGPAVIQNNYYGTANVNYGSYTNSPSYSPHLHADRVDNVHIPAWNLNVGQAALPAPSQQRQPLPPNSGAGQRLLEAPTGRFQQPPRTNSNNWSTAGTAGRR